MSTPTQLTYWGDNFLRLKLLNIISVVVYPGETLPYSDGGGDILSVLEADVTMQSMCILGLIGEIDPAQVDTKFKAGWLQDAITNTNPDNYRTSIKHPPYN